MAVILTQQAHLMANSTVGSRPSSRTANIAKRFSLVRGSDADSLGGSGRRNASGLPSYSFATIDPLDPQPADQTVKIVCVGDGGCGKTCLLVTYARGKFPETYVPTVFENYVANVRSSNGQLIEVALWDTAGQEEYDRLRALSYPDANVILLCFSVDSPTSLDNVYDKWIPEVTHHCPGVPIVIVGLKTDLRQDEETVDRLQSRSQRPLMYEDGDLAAKSHGAVRYVECSARTGEGLREVFDLAITTVVNPRLVQPGRQDRKGDNNDTAPPHRRQPYSYPELSGPTIPKKRRKCLIL